MIGRRRLFVILVGRVFPRLNPRGRSRRPLKRARLNSASDLFRVFKLFKRQPLKSLSFFWIKQLEQLFKLFNALGADESRMISILSARTGVICSSPGQVIVYGLVVDIACMS